MKPTRNRHPRGWKLAGDIVLAAILAFVGMIVAARLVG